jgi:sodium/bile acid cotransporter 7
MMTTVVTNLACIVVAPIGIALVLSQQAEIDALAQMKKLALLVVAPLVLAQLMRRFGLAIWADRTKSRISLLAQIGILAMVVFGAIRSGNQPITDDSPTGWVPGIGVVLAAAAIHIIALMIGVFAARQSGQSRDRQIAVGIAGSQ